MRWTQTLIASSLALTACGSTTGVEGDLCMIEPLPLSADPNAPTITDVGLEIQPGEGVIVVATATDPDGTDNLRDVLQSVGVFPDAQCEGVPIVLRDDLVGSGVEETFGTAVSATNDPALYEAIAAAVRWPVEVDFSDADANRTTGRVFARIMR